MNAHVTAINRNVKEVNTWLNEISQELNHIDHEDAWTRLRAVLQTLRDRLTVDEAAAFAAQLPTLVRGLYFEGWRPAEAPHKWRHKDEYIDAVRQHLQGREHADPEQSIRAVLSVIGRHIDPAELEKIKSHHNKALWDLWPAPSDMAASTEELEAV